MRRIKSHTLQKLEYLKKYIEGYLNATKRLKTKFYIDAFAGSGTCILCDKKCKSKGNSRCQKCSNGEIIDGSALISVKAKNKFNKYCFIDLNPIYIEELKKEIAKIEDDNLKKKIKIIKNDANVILKNLYKSISEYDGCLIFLDLVSAELEWDTIKNLALIKKIDLFILYPYDMSLVRLTKNFGEKLDKFYGDSNWLSILKNNQSAATKKKALLNYYINNLEKLGFECTTPRQIRKKLRSGKPIYHLILASHRKIAKKIMDDIFNTELDGQQKFKF